MKKFLLIITLTIASACASKSDEQLEADKAKFMKMGNEISAHFMKELKGELLSAINKGGPANAISVCSTSVIPITSKIAEWDKYNVEIKRTSFKFRNPDNAPDRREASVLMAFEKTASENPKELVPQVEFSSESPEVFYFKPMKVGGLCINCHGSENNLSPEVRQKLNELYPEDKATGYIPGDFRGMIRIRFSEK